MAEEYKEIRLKLNPILAKMVEEIQNSDGYDNASDAIKQAIRTHHYKVVRKTPNTPRKSPPTDDQIDQEQELIDKYGAEIIVEDGIRIARWYEGENNNIERKIILKS